MILKPLRDFSFVVGIRHKHAIINDTKTYVKGKSWLIV